MAQGKIVSLTGPKGSLTQAIKPAVDIKIEDNTVFLSNKKPEDHVLTGLYRSLLANMTIGVDKGWNKGLEIKGVGFRASVLENKLILTVGFTNPIEYIIPKGILIDVVENKINVSGIDKQLVGQAAATIRGFKPPEPYKGKGIRYIGEKVRKKAGKQAVKVGASQGG